MKPGYNRFARRADGTAPPKERDAADVRRTDKHLALLEARLASHGTVDLAEWLRASPIAGADETSRACVMLRLNRITDIAARTLARDALR